MHVSKRFWLFLPKKKIAIFVLNVTQLAIFSDCLGSETELFPLLLAKTSRNYELLSVPDKYQPLDLAHSFVENEKKMQF